MRNGAVLIAEWILERDNIAVATHIAPDGDAIGSALAVAFALERLGKRACAVCQDPVTPRLRALPGWEALYAPEALPFAPDAVLVLDCGDAGRLGASAALLDGREAALVDHHATNVGFITPAFIDAEASSTGELALEVLEALGVKLDKRIAECLFSAIASDTGSFAFANTTPAAFRAAAACLEAGADVARLSFELFRRISRPRAALIGKALSGAEFTDGGALVYMAVTLDDLEAANARRSDAESIVNYGVETEGVRVSVFACEQEDGARFSLRSDGTVDVSRVALSLGGGGHARAAGVTLAIPMAEAAERVLAAVRGAL